ncbi:MAG TPA: beta-L-arabinofuranosidase domain-containing protein, partial [Cyclobacteriaceae bacterium]|nr:beta-L-arabinofuranosidase domain-containing protein [Cyclobacteriaceae bacterium]
RWEKERELSHELYNSGHLYEAAAAHYHATGKKNLLDIALKNADLVCSTFGHDKKHVAPGHEVVEMGLVKLYRITGKKEYLETAKYFIEERGHYAGYDASSKDLWKNGAYWQDHIPVVEQKEALGHAVRAGYLYAAIADVAALTGDKDFIKAIDSIWNNVVRKKIYVQGGIGAIGDGERFGENYELPNATAYNETCAAIANVYWNHRMFLLHGESKYIDILEKSLYNGLISGVGMDGKSFFYTNAMEIKNMYSHKDMEAERSGWFTCSCCPTNITRLIPSVPGYVYAQKNNDIYVNLFVSGNASFTVDKKLVEIEQRNNYPWDGNLTFNINPKSQLAFNLLVRLPGWSQNEAMPSDLYAFESPSDKKVSITINGKAVDYTVVNGYAVLSKIWKKGDVVQVNLPMEVRRVVASKNVKDDIGKVSLQRGPLMYCAEWPDNNGKTSNIILPKNAQFATEFKSDLLHGATVIKSETPAIVISGNVVSTINQNFTAIPYYAWAHRGRGEMEVWFPEEVKNVDILSK